jgi:hypothetical protein
MTVPITVMLSREQIEAALCALRRIGSLDEALLQLTGILEAAMTGHPDAVYYLTCPDGHRVDARDLPVADGGDGLTSIAGLIRSGELGKRAARVRYALVPPSGSWTIVFPDGSPAPCTGLDAAERIIESAERNAERGPVHGDPPPWVR